MSQQLSVNRLSGPDDNDDREVPNPSWPEIEAAIRGLDGDRCTLVILGIGDSVPHMGVGGGGGKYVVYLTDDNLTFYNLIDPQAASGTFELKAGGQFGDYQLRQRANLDQVLVAAKTYAQIGKPDPALRWEKQ